MEGFVRPASPRAFGLPDDYWPPVPAKPTGAHRQGPRSWPQLPHAWPLVIVLLLQTALSARLLRADTAYPDEAMCLWAGHLLWAHWLHGMPVPPFQAYFAGAPVLYPPIGALADSIGGLTAARALSLCMMLGTTALLWSITSTLFGRRAAAFATATFAVLGPTLLLGALATYNPMALLLLATATWCVVRAGVRADATGWMLLAGVALVLANATAYPTLAFDPFVIVIAVVVAQPRPGGKAALARGATLLTVVATLLMAGVLVSGVYYLTGVDLALSPNSDGAASASLVLAKAGAWVGPVIVVACCAAAASWRGRRPPARTWLVTALACAVLLVPVTKAVLGVAPVLGLNMDYGAFFGAVAAGFGLDWLITSMTDRAARLTLLAACLAAMTLPITLGAVESVQLATSWPDARSFRAILGPLIDHGNGRLLIEDPRVAEYYLPAGKQWTRWSSTWDVRLSSGLIINANSNAHPDSADSLTDLIAGGYFSVVALNFADTTALDHAINTALHANHHYHIVEVVPYGRGPYVIWQYQKREAAQRYQPAIGSSARSGQVTTTMRAQL
jgi:hypothetical protein